MKKYRKKPVAIEAVQYNGKNIEDIEKFMNRKVERYINSDSIFIFTLEGTMEASVGDYVIKGVNGEFYPCKPDIFKKTYEEVDE